MFEYAEWIGKKEEMETVAKNYSSPYTCSNKGPEHIRFALVDEEDDMLLIWIVLFAFFYVYIFSFRISLFSMGLLFYCVHLRGKHFEIMNIACYYLIKETRKLLTQLIAKICCFCTVVMAPQININDIIISL